MDTSVADELQQMFPRETWMHNRSLTVVGNKENHGDYVKVSVIHGKERSNYYELVGMQRWQLVKPHLVNISCLEWLDQNSKNIKNKPTSDTNTKI